MEMVVEENRQKGGSFTEPKKKSCGLFPLKKQNNNNKTARKHPRIANLLQGSQSKNYILQHKNKIFKWFHLLQVIWKLS